MGVTGGTAHLDAAHAVAAVFARLDAALGNDLTETWPPTVGFEFVLGAEQLASADDAPIASRLEEIPEVAAKGPLGVALLGDAPSEFANARTEFVTVFMSIDAHGPSVTRCNGFARVVG